MPGQSQSRRMPGSPRRGNGAPRLPADMLHNLPARGGAVAIPPPWRARAALFDLTASPRRLPCPSPHPHPTRPPRADNADDMGLFGSLDLRPAADHAPGAMRPVWDWDSQLYTGEIPEVAHTFNVVGNVNENGVIITETTFGGRADLDGGGTGAIMSYGDLIFTTLQRATSARGAIAIMDALCQEYGYESSGESFGVADGDEVWLMELIGKGKYGKGAVWVASRVPDGYVGATANQARTRTFAQADPDNVLFSPDIVAFARSIGAFNGTADADFDFREAFDPISFTGARFAEARVWNVLNPA
jgi:hypothetical protein